MEISQTTCFRVVLPTTTTAMWLERAIVVIFWRKLLLFECEMRVIIWKDEREIKRLWMSAFSKVITGAFFSCWPFFFRYYLLGNDEKCQRKYFFTSFSANIWAMSEKNLPIKTVLFVNQKIIWKFVDLHFYVKINIWIDRKQLMEFWKKKTIIYLSFYLMSFFYIELEIFWWCLIIQNAYSELSFSNRKKLSLKIGKIIFETTINLLNSYQ